MYSLRCTCPQSSVSVSTCRNTPLTSLASRTPRTLPLIFAHRFNSRVLATRRRARRSKSKSQHQMGSRPNPHRRRADKADRGGKGGKPHSASSPSSTPPRTDWERSALRFLTRLDATGEGRRRPRSSPGTGGCWAKRVARAVAACSMWEGSRWSTSRSTTSVLLLAEGY